MVSNPPKLTTLHYKVVRQSVGMGKLPCRDGMMVATRLGSPKSWHEVPGTAELHDPSRRVRYELFLAGDVQLQNRLLYRAIFLLQQPDHTVPTGRNHWVLFQALRARLPSWRPYGTTASSPIVLAPWRSDHLAH